MRVARTVEHQDQQKKEGVYKLEATKTRSADHKGSLDNLEICKIECLNPGEGWQYVGARIAYLGQKVVKNR